MVDATVTLYKDVGLTMGYSRTMDFSSKTAQLNWFKSRPANQKLTLTDVNYNKVQNSFFVHEEVGDVYGYSYVTIENLDSSGRVYYGFISNVTLVDDETTRFDIIIDPLQTFMGEWRIEESYVVRQHLDRWNLGHTVNIDSPSPEKVNAFMRYGNFYEMSDNTIKPVVIALSANNRVTGYGQENQDKIYYVCALVDVANPDSHVYGVRAVRDIQDAGLSSSMYADGVQYPSLNDIVTGRFMDIFSINPDSVISISILPLANVFEVASTVRCKWPGIKIYSTSGTVTANIEPLERTIDIRNKFSNMYVWGLPAIAYYVYATGGQSVLSADLSPIYGGTITSTDYSGSPVMLSYMDSTIDIDDYSYSKTFTVNGPTPPQDGDTYNNNNEPMMWQLPAKEYALYDYRGNKLFTLPGFWSMRLATNTRKITVTPIFDVSGMAIQIQFISLGDVTSSIMDEATQGMITTFQCDTIPFVNDRWLSYKLTSLETDRSNAILSAVGNVVTGGIYGAYGGALVGSRSASGDWDDDERRNTLLKRGAIGASIIGGSASIGAGLVNGMIGWQNQKNKEKAIQNEASQIKTGMGVLSYLNSNFDLYLAYSVCDDFNEYILANNYKYYGYECNIFDTPDIKSRKYYNYIITQGCIVAGPLSADIKQQISRIFDSGITIFHMDYCSTPDYPVNSSGNEYDNIERSLMA